MRKLLRYGGIAASIVLIAFGIGAIVHRLQRSPSGPHATWPASRSSARPTRRFPASSSTPAARRRRSRTIMRHHTLEATGGQTYSQMGQYLDAAGKATDDKAKAAIDPTTKQPVANQARQIWVTETALTTALNTAYFAESVATFAIVMGFALLLSGIGFGVLTFRALGPVPARRERQVPDTAAVPAV